MQIDKQTYQRIEARVEREQRLTSAKHEATHAVTAQLLGSPVGSARIARDAGEVAYTVCPRCRGGDGLSIIRILVSIAPIIAENEEAPLFPLDLYLLYPRLARNHAADMETVREELQALGLIRSPFEERHAKDLGDELMRIIRTLLSPMPVQLATWKITAELLAHSEVSGERVARICESLYLPEAELSGLIAGTSKSTLALIENVSK